MLHSAVGEFSCSFLMQCCRLQYHTSLPLFAATSTSEAVLFSMTRLILKKINMTWTQLRCIGNGNISLQTKYFLLPQLMIFLHTKNNIVIFFKQGLFGHQQKFHRHCVLRESIRNIKNVLNKNHMKF